MKHSAVYLIIFPILNWIFSCNSSETKTREKSEATTENVVKISLEYEKMTNDAGFVYFYPASLKDSSQLDLIILADPQGKGNLPIEKYQNLAKKFGFVLIGSLQSKNGESLETNAYFLKQHLQQFLAKIPDKKVKIYSAGFSGGAKVAFFLGDEDKRIEKIVYCGAGSITNNSIKPSFGFAGTSDMNYSELIAFYQKLNPQKNVFLEWNGKHEWPGEKEMEIALIWCKAFEGNISAAQKLKYKNDNLAKAKAEKNVLVKAQLLLIASQIEASANQGSTIQKEYLTLQKSEIYQNELAKRDQTVQKENLLKASYMQAISDKDENWWQNEIKRLSQKTKAEEAAVNQRLIGFFSLLGYSLGVRFLDEQNVEMAKKVLIIYRLADPKNAEQPYLWARFWAQGGDLNQTNTYLKEAIQLGFSERQKVEQQPDFTQFRSNSAFQNLLSQLH